MPKQNRKSTESQSKGRKRSASAIERDRINAAYATDYEYSMFPKVPEYFRGADVVGLRTRSTGTNEQRILPFSNRSRYRKIWSDQLADSDKYILMLISEHRHLTDSQLETLVVVPSAIRFSKGGGYNPLKTYMRYLTEEKYSDGAHDNRLDYKACFKTRTMIGLLKKLNSLQKMGLIEPIVPSHRIEGHGGKEFETVPSLFTRHWYLTLEGARLLCVNTAVNVNGKTNTTVGFVGTYQEAAFISIVHESECNDIFCSMIECCEYASNIENEELWEEVRDTRAKLARSNIGRAIKGKIGFDQVMDGDGQVLDDADEEYEENGDAGSEPPAAKDDKPNDSEDTGIDDGFASFEMADIMDDDTHGGDGTNYGKFDICRFFHEKDCEVKKAMIDGKMRELGFKSDGMITIYSDVLGDFVDYYLEYDSGTSKANSIAHKIEAFMKYWVVQKANLGKKARQPILLLVSQKPSSFIPEMNRGKLTLYNKGIVKVIKTKFSGMLDTINDECIVLVADCASIRRHGAMGACWHKIDLTTGTADRHACDLISASRKVIRQR